MPPIKKYGSIQLHADTLANLAVDPTVWLEGQPVFCYVAIDKIGLKIGDGVRLFPALPWVVNPYAESPAAPFKVRLGDSNYSVIANVGSGQNDTVITDDRLKGRDDYIITNSETNVEFRTADLIYDSVNGKVTIKSFELTAGSNISIFPNWVTSIPEGTAGIIADLEKAVAPILAGGVIFIWKKPRIFIPSGWRPVTSLAGKMIMGWNPSNDIEGRKLRQQGGSETAALTEENNGPHSHGYSNNQNGSFNGTNRDLTSGGANGSNTNRTTNNSGEGKPFSILNPYEIIDFIEMDEEIVEFYPVVLENTHSSIDPAITIQLLAQNEEVISFDSSEGDGTLKTFTYATVGIINCSLFGVNINYKFILKYNGVYQKDLTNGETIDTALYPMGFTIQLQIIV